MVFVVDLIFLIRVSKKKDYIFLHYMKHIKIRYCGLRCSQG